MNIQAHRTGSGVSARSWVSRPMPDGDETSAPNISSR